MPLPFDAIVFSDLDATLLDHDTYSFDDAQPALARLRNEKIPLVLVTSKTIAEITPIREALGVPGESISENGARSQDYQTLCASLRDASRETGVEIRAAHQMTIEEVAAATGLSLEAAHLARQRQFSEPFHILDPAHAPDLLNAIERRNLKWTRGGRFYHVFERGGKGEAVAAILARSPGVTSIGLGDAPNDIDFLRVVEYPVIVRSPRTDQMLAALPNARVTRLPGPAGWSESLLALLDELAQSASRP